MLKLKLQYFGHLRQRADSLEKTLMLRKLSTQVCLRPRTPSQRSQTFFSAISGIQVGAEVALRGTQKSSFSLTVHLPFPSG